jgi:hypothetical protein
MNLKAINWVTLVENPQSTVNEVNHVTQRTSIFFLLYLSLRGPQK